MNGYRPGSEEELAAIVGSAAASGEALQIVGGGTRRLGHQVQGTRLETADLSGIALYEPGALTLVVRAGMPLAEVEAVLAAEGQRLPFEPWDARALMATDGAPTIGGMVATNASGPRRLAAGACRDSLIGVRFVDGTGAVVKNGGRVMKNVTGLDLVKLMAGSHGTLGVLTELAFKVLPAPEAVVTLAFDGLDVGRAVAAMTAATATPFELSGAAHVPAGLGDGPVTLLRLEGFAASVAYRAGALAEWLTEFGQARRVEGSGDWEWVRDVRGFAGRAEDVWRVSVRPTDGPRVAAALAPLGAEMLLDWAGGLVWALVPEGSDLRRALAGIPGHATLVRGGEATGARFGVFPPEPAPVARLADGLRARFDPRGVLNPGRMTGRAAAAA
jgi:glycolate oxidase FAD binding subunit